MRLKGISKSTSPGNFQKLLSDLSSLGGKLKLLDLSCSDSFGNSEDNFSPSQSPAIHRHSVLVQLPTLQHHFMLSAPKGLGRGREVH